MDKLEFNLETIDGRPFEQFGMAFLRDLGYKVHESGASGPDGGWDGRVKLGEREGIAHVSTANRWKQKLRNDAESVRDLELERGEDYDLFVFVTNQRVQGDQELDLEADIREEYGWELRIHHRDNILGEIRQNHPELASDFFDIDLDRDREFLEDLAELRTNRLEDIRNQDDYAVGIREGPLLLCM